MLRAEVVCTELVSNAVDHGGGGGEVRLRSVADGWLIEVDDTDPDGVLTPGRSRLGGNRGRGLTLVGAFATWGVRRTLGGKTVWANIALPA
ncbi:ATP-binding protein [Pseudonocardia sp. HH130629-09]|uniref:ATP-binding protein n=1 Tax=Pseudonocardia sp. HH130629-09 TaxID=1641402 RepID=UPI0011AE6040|nr:ATP-binding protein [Pseudonocardia sp. HH130629-09]